MSGGRLKTSPSASNGFSSTPVKSGHQKRDFHKSNVLDDGVLSDDEDTFSLLSPIYHDSFDSDEDPDPSPDHQTSPRPSDSSRHSVSPERCELPKTPSEQMLLPSATGQNTPSLSPWEMWLVNKAKEDRLKAEKKAEEERLLKEKKKEEEREQQQKMIVVEEKIHEWLKMKKEQEKHEQLMRKSKKEEEIQRKQEMQRESHQKAQQKYKDWLQKKNQEKAEKEKKQREEAALKEEQEKVRREKAEEKFKEWLTKSHVKSRPSPKSPRHPTSPYDKSCPSPSFYNPIPWRPIHIPPPEPTISKTTDRKPQKHRKGQQSSSTASRLRNTASAAQSLQRR
ncbi:coiled-coil domain-containing protein 34 [Sphaeramia orbicularis]|uniref:Coiled-coil domain-containing protein 34-like n=1 Tax=Sphaeramia orbicularis TaxID=375764 RepID=A0A672YQN9_9TELE|nr:coiled-coil domain-containing protein 34-like [Sphaeramia orbicularis]